MHLNGLMHPHFQAIFRYFTKTNHMKENKLAGESIIIKTLFSALKIVSMSAQSLVTGGLGGFRLLSSINKQFSRHSLTWENLN